MGNPGKPCPKACHMWTNVYVVVFCFTLAGLAQRLPACIWKGLVACFTLAGLVQRSAACRADHASKNKSKNMGFAGWFFGCWYWFCYWFFLVFWTLFLLILLLRNQLIWSTHRINIFNWFHAFFFTKSRYWLGSIDDAQGRYDWSKGNWSLSLVTRMSQGQTGTGKKMC